MKKKIIPTSIQDLGDRQILFTISNEEQDRDEDIMIAAGCDFKNFAKNPQFLGFHNYYDFPLGRPISWSVDPASRSVKAVVYFPTIDELTGGCPQNASEKTKLVDTTYYFYKNKLLNAVSIGFNVTESNPNPKSQSGYGSVISKWELLEFSAVPVPANQSALVEACKSYDPSGRMGKIFQEAAMKKGAIPYHKYPLADESTTWDAGEVTKASEVEDLPKICAWKADKEPEELTKGDFKLPHHLAKADGYKTVWAGVKAAMGALLGARGGTSIPEADQKDVYDHLAKHYAEFSKDPPEWGKSYTEAEMKSFGFKTGARLSAESSAALDDIEKCYKALKTKATKVAALHDEMKGHLDDMDELHGKMKAAIKKLRNGPQSDDEEEPPEGQGDGQDENVLDIEDEE